MTPGHQTARRFSVVGQASRLSWNELRPPGGTSFCLSNLYLGYFATEENSEGDNPPIGIILTRNKDELLVEYATYQMNSQLFVQKYQLYLPDRDELRRELELTLQATANLKSQENHQEK
jgi:hypothetical protein